MRDDPYRLLATRLDELPNGFPPTADGAELRLLARIFTPEEAALAAGLRRPSRPPRRSRRPEPRACRRRRPTT
jgi:electron transport complex protein RnfB